MYGLSDQYFKSQVRGLHAYINTPGIITLHFKNAHGEKKKKRKERRTKHFTLYPKLRNSSVNVCAADIVHIKESSLSPKRVAKSSPCETQREMAEPSSGV